MSDKAAKRKLDEEAGMQTPVSLAMFPGPKEVQLLELGGGYGVRSWNATNTKPAELNVVEKDRLLYGAVMNG